MFTYNPSRRNFLTATAAVLGSFILPRRLFAKTPDHPFWFLHVDTLNSWPVADPVKWVLENAREPILERASEGLRKLDADQGDRIIRLVVRRCRLNLLEVRPEQVVVHHWILQCADLRPFFKDHGLALPQVEILVRERKKEGVTTQRGDDFLYGVRIWDQFSPDLLQSKWQARNVNQPDDWTAVPGTETRFAWEGVRDYKIPWAVLKSAWRHAPTKTCQNCDTTTVLTNFGKVRCGFLSTAPSFYHTCLKCHRSFKDETVEDVKGWMAANLDSKFMPDYEMGLNIGNDIKRKLEN